MTDLRYETFVTRLIEEIADPFSVDEVLRSSDLTEGILDSLGIVEILELVEDVYGIDIAEEEVTRDDFKTMTSIKALVESHRY